LSLLPALSRYGVKVTYHTTNKYSKQVGYLNHHNIISIFAKFAKHLSCIQHHIKFSKNFSRSGNVLGSNTTAASSLHGNIGLVSSHALLAKPSQYVTLLAS
jgi:hypothetical protein